MGLAHFIGSHVPNLVRQKEKLAYGEMDGYAKVKQFVLLDLGGFLLGWVFLLPVCGFLFVLFEAESYCIVLADLELCRPIWLQTQEIHLPSSLQCWD